MTNDELNEYVMNENGYERYDEKYEMTNDEWNEHVLNENGYA